MGELVTIDLSFLRQDPDLGWVELKVVLVQQGKDLGPAGEALVNAGRPDNEVVPCDDALALVHAVAKNSGDHLLQVNIRIQEALANKSGH